MAKLSAEGAGRIFNVVLSVLGARMLGPANWGLYWSAFGLGQLTALGTDLGGHLTLSRTVARSPRTAWQSLAMTAGIKGTLMLITIVGMFSIAPLLVHPRSLIMMTLGAALLLSTIEWLGCFLRGLGRVREEALVLGGASVVACVIGTTALLLDTGVAGLAGSQVLAMLIALVATVAWVLRMAPPTPGISGALGTPTRGFIGAAWPTGVAILVSMTSWRLVYVLASFLDGSLPSDLGHYATAQRLLEIGRFLPAAVAAALFPSFVATRGSVSPGRALLPLMGTTTLIATALTFPHVASLVMLGVFGSDYASAGPALAVFSWALPFMCVNAVLTHWLIARGHAAINAGLSCLHLAAHFVGIIYIPRLLGVDSMHDALPFGYHLRGADLLAGGLVFAEAILATGTLIAWRRLK